MFFLIIAIVVAAIAWVLIPTKPKSTPVGAPGPVVPQALAPDAPRAVAAAYSPYTPGPNALAVAEKMEAINRVLLRRAQDKFDAAVIEETQELLASE